MTLHPDLIALESGPPGSQPTLLHVASGRWPARIRAAPFMTIVNTAHFAIAVLAASILALTASRLKLAPFCIGGNAIAVIANFSTSCWTNTKRQNSYLNQSKYCRAPYLVP